jgi:hypothetical protein
MRRSVDPTEARNLIDRQRYNIPTLGGWVQFG